MQVPITVFFLFTAGMTRSIWTREKKHSSKTVILIYFRFLSPLSSYILYCVTLLLFYSTTIKVYSNYCNVMNFYEFITTG